MNFWHVNVARFARKVEWDFFCDFQTPWTSRPRNCLVCLLKGLNAYWHSWNSWGDHPPQKLENSRVLFRKQEGGKLQWQHLWGKDDFCSFSLALVFFGMVANVWCSFFSSRPFYPQSRSVVYSVFLACNYIAEHGQLGTVDENHQKCLISIFTKKKVPKFILKIFELSHRK